MHTEAIRRAEGRIAALRCLEASKVAVDDRTRYSLERAATRYLLKAIGIEKFEEDLGTATEGDFDAAPLLDPWENQQTSAPGLGSNALGWE